MDHIGIDVPKKERQIYILAEGDEVIERRIPHRGRALRGLCSAPDRARGS